MSSCCQCAAPGVQPASEPRAPASPPASGWVRLAVAAAIAAQSMIFSLAINLSPPPVPARLWLHATLALSAVLVFALVGRPVLREALAAAARGRIVVEQLFLAGIFAAFVASLLATITGTGHVYYEVVAILLAIYTFGRTLGARRRRSALDAARALGEEFATCELLAPDGTIARTAVREIRAGDEIHIPIGQGVPVDGIVTTGHALVDESALTGEPFPSTRHPGDPVLAGSRLVDGPLRVRATTAGEARTLDALFARVQAAQSQPSRLQREADRVVAWFLPTVIGIALLTFAGWTAHAGWSTGLYNALSVILVACPCSLGLATPIGVWSALADLARRGVIANSSDLVERLAGVRHVIFDKTGTLGDEHLTVVELATAPGVNPATLRAEIAALEAVSHHPIARAFRGPAPAGLAHDVELLSGIGIAGRVGEATLRIGNTRLLNGESPTALRAQLRNPDAASREIFILRDGSLAGLALLREQLRAGARPVLAELAAADLSCTVLTGDDAPAAAAHGFTRLETGLSPEAKAARVRTLSASDGRALFVGDGVNDAPAMAEAHASLALDSGCQLSRDTALGSLHDLRAIPFAIARCRAAVRTIRQNLLFAAGYNVIGITLAAAGILHPVAAALLMLASSLTVSWRALRPAEVV